MRNKLEEGQKTLREYLKKQQHYQDKMSKLTLQNEGYVSSLNHKQFISHRQNLTWHSDSEEQDSQGIHIYTKDELADMDKDELQHEIAALEKRNENTSVDLSVLSEYRKRAEEYAARKSDLSAAIAARDAEKRHHDELQKLRTTLFVDGLKIINDHLKVMYDMISMGGTADLVLVDSLDPFAEGIVFSVKPPKKSWKSIFQLSGGEKTLSSLALVFALHQYKPTPLYVMDEIDAALDFRNVSIIANYIKDRTKSAQFIVISLRNQMFELATRLVGVYKVNHMVSRIFVYFVWEVFWLLT
jgi:structural maintenance of chromosome 4